ncbi:MAG: hypothetical protein ACHQ01_00515 [Candidatus Limnocylindrales bacterium]
MIIDESESNPHEEPCLVCGEETAVGSVFFSDRHAAELPDGTRGFLCSACIQRIRAKGYPVGPSEGRLVEGSVITLAQGWF